MPYQAPRGTHDVLPKESHLWRHLEATFCRVAELYGYQEIRTPVFEDYDLFVRTSGDTSEVVTKQMYEFTDKGDRHVALKPEGTAPAIRSYLEHSLGQTGSTTRLWYFTQIFRYERPQKGRYRQAHQFGVELIGSSSPLADVEVIDLTSRFYAALGISTQVLVNCIGRDETRARYREVILEHVKPWLDQQDGEGQARALKNPLRLLDTKDPELLKVIADVPPVTDSLEDASRAHFDAVREELDRLGIAYRLAPEVVRGLDYYTDTVFEIHSSALGAQGALCGGGRYDNLIKDIGGPATPSVGVGIGVERALIALEQTDFQLAEPRVRVYLVAATDSAKPKVRELAQSLRAKGVSCQFDLDERSMKSQLKAADRSGAECAVMIGDDELAKGTVTVRTLATSQQEEIPVDAWMARFDSAR